MIIKNGTVYDPLNEINGEKMDICAKDGKIAEEAGGKKIDASGLVVMPGGVDIHTHVSGSKVNSGRSLRPEDHRKDVVPKTDVTRSGVGYTVPNTFLTGYRYAQLGYTTVMEAAQAPLGARHTHEELNDIPILDNGVFTLMGNNHFVLKYANDEPEKLKNYVSWLLRASKGYAVKLVNPGGVENWKWGSDVDSLDDQIENYGVTPQEVIASLARINDELELPHSIHLHCNNLGMPGNRDTLVETAGIFAESLGSPGNYEATVKTGKRANHRLHLTHVQFNAYGGESWADLSSGAEEVAEVVNKNDNISCDIGQVIFDDVTTMTADGPWQHRLYKLSEKKWNNHDVEMEAGSGIVPYKFKKSNPANAVQWTIGLEVALLVDDPWRVYPTTDHPNAGPFYYYPKMFSWLMSKKLRNEVLEDAPKAASSRSGLGSIEREYSLYEIAIVTRAGPANRLGLENKGHLGVGADADVAIYDFDGNNIEKSFSKAKYVIKDGELVVKDGEIVKNKKGKTLWTKTKGEITDEMREDFSKYYTVEMENYPVSDNYLPREEVIHCG
ncbi:hypothetical protein AKJ63_01030 [candidate division MSBL1 archaeon SCGC-AAA259D18]|uniref:Amidohydrolase 3 domain-containing protein n=2 Tax=candidate division MSBL1 TaxID=215777 RepID=A0A133UAX9_9EURY|nr:hypothetical protein AKJ57_01535 [candidate division MSBL1 archaeon SCGC-AAA259A05]KXA91758.1 hypothetical protein AKJ63_01030 [candidate division MSBL1 archaeon SCGC-AAA259D18]